jgi:lipase chaperone LimK
MTKIILLTDVLETKLRKEKELEFYQKELEKLQQKMFFIQKDIEITNLCIQIIEQEKVLDIRETMRVNMLGKDGD